MSNICFSASNMFLVGCLVPAGSQAEFIINTSRAVQGPLAVTIEGPSKVKMDCQEVPEGYKVQYTPMAPGNYLISIKYGGPAHIAGSPFKAKVSGEGREGQTVPLCSALVPTPPTTRPSSCSSRSS